MAVKSGDLSLSDEIDLTIENLGGGGDGIGTYDGMPIFVPLTVVGDKVRVRIDKIQKKSASAELLAMYKAGQERIAPACPHFGRCGGCSMQMLSATAYDEWAAERIRVALLHQHIEGVDIRPVIASPPQSRRRAALHAAWEGKTLRLGFNARRSHQIEDIGDCPLLVPALTALISPLRALMQSILPKPARATIHLTATDTGVDMLLEAPFTLDLALSERLTDFAHTHDIAAISLQAAEGAEPVITRRKPAVKLGGVGVALPPGAFLQATRQGEAALLEGVLTAVKDSARVADLFAGLGTFTLALARRHAVHAVEGAKPALDGLQSAAARVSAKLKLKQVTTEHRDLYRNPLRPAELKGYDAVVFDPPRAGAEAQAQMLAQSEVPRIVAVSCNPTSFARDARILAAGGYKLSYIQPVAQFLWSAHLELVAMFDKG